MLDACSYCKNDIDYFIVIHLDLNLSNIIYLV